MAKVKFCCRALPSGLRLAFLLHGSPSLDSAWGPLISQTVRLLIDGEVVREVSPTSDGVQRVFWEVPEYIGQMAQMQIEDSNRYITTGRDRLRQRQYHRAG